MQKIADHVFRRRVHTAKQRCSSFVAPSYSLMRVHIKHWSAVAQWHWNTGNNDPDDEGDVCGICRVPYEGCCPSCKMPGDDCPLSTCSFPCTINHVSLSFAVWGECSHIFHMHCLLKWLGTAASKQQCPMDRRPWGTCVCRPLIMGIHETDTRFHSHCRTKSQRRQQLTLIASHHYVSPSNQYLISLYCIEPLCTLFHLCFFLSSLV